MLEHVSPNVMSFPSRGCTRGGHTVLGKQRQILSAMSNNTRKISGIQTRPLWEAATAFVVRITIKKNTYFGYNLVKLFLLREKKKEKKKNKNNKENT